MSTDESDELAESPSDPHLVVPIGEVTRRTGNRQTLPVHTMLVAPTVAGILVPDAVVEKKARALLKRVGVPAARVEFFRVPTDRSWTRDTCPLFVTDDSGRVAITNWRFNGWAKYANHKKDDAINDRLAKRLKMST